MSTNRSRRIDRDAAEHLLGGAVGGPSAGQDASLTGPDGPGQLARVLAAAAAPATAAELAGEEAALAAFREASLTPDPVVTPVRRRSMATAALARAFSTKAAAAVLGATALCGVAVAAGTGNLPSPLGGGTSEPEHAVAAPGSPSGASTGTGTGTGTGSASPGGTTRPSVGALADPHRTVPPDPASPNGPTAGEHPGHPAPPAALLPLCERFADRTGKGERPGKVAADPLFAPLVAAAGGADEVQDYCGGAPGHQDGDHQGNGPQPSPSGAGKGTGKGSGNADGKDGTNGKGNGNGNTNGNEDTNGNGDGKAKPGKGPAIPTPSNLPTPPDTRPGRTGPSEDQQSARS